MKTCSIAYVLFVTAAIPALFMLSKLMVYVRLGDAEVIVANIAHGLSIVLFFHLIARFMGLSFGWRILFVSVLPTLIFTIYYATAPDPIHRRIVFAVHEVLVFFTVKFLVCSVIAEFTMRALEKRVGWLGCPKIGE